MATNSETTGLLHGSSRSTYSGNMKLKYVKEIPPWLHDPQENIIAGLIARNRGTTMGGSKNVTSVAVARPQGVGHRGEGFPLPFKGNGTYINPELTPKKIVMRHGQTAEAILDSRGGDSVAWNEVMGAEMALLRRQLQATWVRNLYGGRADVLGVVQSVAGAALTLYGRNQRGGTAAQFFRRGAITDPFYEGQFLSFVPSANGLFGSPTENALTSVGDPTGITARTAARYIITGGINVADPTAPIITLDTDASAQIAAGAYIVGYGSRRRSVNADGNIAIQDVFGLEGIGSYNTGSAICANIYGYTKASYTGLMPVHLTNPAGVGTYRSWDIRLGELMVRRGLTASGKTINTLVITPAQLSEVFAADRNLRRLEPVIGKQGGDTSTMSYIWHGINLGLVTDWMALPNAAIGVNPDLYEYWENYALGPPPNESGKRFVDGVDATEELYIMRGNIANYRPMAVSFCDDLVEDEFN